MLLSVPAHAGIWLAAERLLRRGESSQDSSINLCAVEEVVGPLLVVLRVRSPAQGRHQLTSLSREREDQAGR